LSSTPSGNRLAAAATPPGTRELPRDHATFSAPARVNLIGEHTDYTGGLVLPMAIPFYTIATISPRGDGLYDFESDRFDGSRQMPLADRSEATHDWSDYPVGVLRMLQLRGVEPPPFTLWLTGDVPLGAGLSSSASVEVASAVAMLAHACATLAIEEIALLCQRAENDYVHSPCGIMDQFVVTAAKAGYALLLNTRTLRYEHLPMNHGGLADTQVVVCNSMVKHSVATGEYGMRRRESEQGQAILLRKFPQLRDLGDATIEQLQAAQTDMPEKPYRRCRHIITENARVRAARDAFFAGDPVALGALILGSHQSQRYDFECSIGEIDFLVDTAANLPGCFGARLTGGGFGGCTVNLVARQHTERFVDSLKAAYRERFNITAETYVCEAVDGAMLRNAQALPHNHSAAATADTAPEAAKEQRP
jgi:galactokinase